MDNDNRLNRPGFMRAVIVPCLFLIFALGCQPDAGLDTLSGTGELQLRFVSPNEVQAIDLRPHPWEFALYYDA